MKAAQLAPHGKVEWLGWHPEKHPAVQHALGGHRALAGLAALTVVVAVAVFGISAALAPVRSTTSIAPNLQQPMFEAFKADAAGASAMPLNVLRKVFGPSELAAIAAARTVPSALGASRPDDQILDRQVKALRTSVTTPVTLDPIALAASNADDRSLDSQVQGASSDAGTATAPRTTVTAPQTRFAGKPLPL